MEVWAKVKNMKGSPQKLRLILEAVKGRPVNQALMILQNMPSSKAREIAKVVKSASANAENNYDMNPALLKVVRAFADPGPSTKRFRPRARGRVGLIHKRFSHITVVVDEES